MADGTTLNPGSGGDKIQTEDFGGAGKIPRSKIVLGAVDADGGDLAAGQTVMAHSLPVVLASDHSAVTVGGTVAATSAAGAQADGHSITVGTTSDASSALTLVGLLKAIKAYLAGSLGVTGTFWQATQPVSNASLPLPTGASTSALQGAGMPAALGAGGGMKVDGSGTPLPVSGTVMANLQPVASGGLTPFRTISLVATAQAVKASAGQVYGWYFYNNAAATRYVRFYDVASSPTVGTATIALTLPIPAYSAANVAFPNGIAFVNGIYVACTTGVADTDTGAPTANDVVANLFWK